MDKSTCSAAMIIKECRNHPELKRRILNDDFGLLLKHIVENEKAWNEEELYGKESKPSTAITGKLTEEEV